MNITQAKTALLRLYGNKATWRYNEKAPKADEREEIKTQLPALTAAKNEAKEACDQRRKELLQDPEYVRLRAAWQSAERAADNALSLMHSYRVCVGTTNGMFFHVTAQGDNWQDTIDKARAKAKEAA